MEDNKYVTLVQEGGVCMQGRTDHETRRKWLGDSQLGEGFPFGSSSHARYRVNQ